MSDVISDSVCKLSAITDQTPIDWDDFDSVLKGLEDINAYDEQAEETILSEFILDGNFYKRASSWQMLSVTSSLAVMMFLQTTD